MGTWTHFSSAAEITPGEMLMREFGDKQIVVAHVNEEFFAFANMCSHEQVPLCDGYLERHEIECPMHGARFDVRTGAVKCAPAVRPIATYPLRVVENAEGKQIEVEIETGHCERSEAISS